MIRSSRQKTKEPLIPASEVRFRFSRSSGPGGQHVNKASTRVEALFDVAASSLSPEAQSRVLSALGDRCDADGNLVVASESSRSQWKNREDALRRLDALVRGALVVRRKRKKTAVSAATRARRRFDKQARSKTKAARRPPDAGS